MKPSAPLLLSTLFGAVCGLHAQEATSGFDLRTTITGQGVYSPELTEPPRSGGTILGGARVMLYPTWKLNNHWTITASLQAYTRPFFRIAILGARLRRDNRRTTGEPQLHAVLESSLDKCARGAALLHVRIVSAAL